MKDEHDNLRKKTAGIVYLCQHFAVCPEFFGLYVLPIWPMEKRIKKNEKSSQHRSQNFRFSPLAEMASEAKM